MSLNDLRLLWQRQDEQLPLSAAQLAAIKDSFMVKADLVAVAQAPGYAVSRDGRVFSALPCTWKECPRELRPAPHRYGGYLVVRLHVNKRSVPIGIHQLVARAFLPPPAPAQVQVRHLDGNPANNRLENLAWGTALENGADAIRHGRSRKGSRAFNAKLTEEQVRTMRTMRAEGFTYAVIGARFGVQSGAAWYAIHRGWTHVG